MVRKEIIHLRYNINYNYCNIKSDNWEHDISDVTCLRCLKSIGKDLCIALDKLHLSPKYAIKKVKK